MSSRLTTQCTVAGFALLAGALTIPIHRASAQAGTIVSLSGSYPSCSNGDINPGAPSGSPTSMAWIATLNGTNCNARGSGFAYLGVVGASASARMQNLGPNNSFFIKSDVSAGWTEQVTPDMNTRYLTALDVRKLRVTFTIGATGSVVATRSGASGGAQADIKYTFQFGSANGEGFQVMNSTLGLSTSPANTWGTITRTVDIFTNGGFGFNPFTFTMGGSATALVTHGNDPGELELAQADFGSTLLWGGVQNVEAFDSFGNTVALGSDAAFSLRGSTTGNDYMNAAALANTVVPEPSTMVLLATGLLGLLFAARRNRQAA